MFVSKARYDRKAAECAAYDELIKKQGKELRELRAECQLQRTRIANLTYQLRQWQPARNPNGRFAKVTPMGPGQEAGLA